MSATHYTIEAQSVDWVVVITNLLKRYNGSGDLAVGIGHQGDFVVYSIPRAAIPADQLAAAIGSTTEIVSGVTGRIVLRPLKKLADWPKPTVEYHGNA